MSWGGAYVRSVKRHNYTVHADDDQAERWEAAAAAQGRMVVGAWLAQVADAYLAELAKSGRPMPLAWSASRFRVLTSNALLAQNPTTEEIEVRGVVSAHFGIFRGDRTGPGVEGCHRHSLVHLPSRRIIGTLRYQRACRALAAELTTLRVDWAISDPEKVVQGAPDEEKAQALLRLFETLARR